MCIVNSEDASVSTGDTRATNSASQPSPNTCTCDASTGAESGNRRRSGPMQARYTPICTINPSTSPGSQFHTYIPKLLDPPGYATAGRMNKEEGALPPSSPCINARDPLIQALRTTPG